MPDTMNLGEHLATVRRIIHRDFYTTIDKEQALIRLAEFEMWMRHAKPKPEASRPAHHRGTEGASRRGDLAEGVRRPGRERHERR